MPKKGRPEVHLDHFTMRLMAPQSKLNRAGAKVEASDSPASHRTARLSSDLFIHGVVLVHAYAGTLRRPDGNDGGAVPSIVPREIAFGISLSGVKTLTPIYGWSNITSAFLLYLPIPNHRKSQSFEQASQFAPVDTRQ
jgi:hypothetical protein